MKPAYAEAAADMKKFLPNARLAAVDATKTSALNKRFKLQGFPTLKYFEKDEFVQEYTGSRTKFDIVNFMTDLKKAATPPPAVDDDWSSISGYEHVTMLTDDDYDNFVKSKPKVMVMVYAPCKSN